MAYCGPKGIPLSTFLSWHPDDQEAALVWQAHESRRCRSCGYHPDDGPVHTHVDVCPGCVANEQRSRSDDSKVRGGQIKLATGTTDQCERCTHELELNRR
jgi:hypothetical protein